MRALFQVGDWWILTDSPHGGKQRGEASSPMTLIRALIRGLHSLLPIVKAPPLKTVVLGSNLSTYNFGVRGSKHSVHNRYWIRMLIAGLQYLTSSFEISIWLCCIIFNNSNVGAKLRCPVTSAPFGNHLSFHYLIFFTITQLIGISRLNDFHQDIEAIIINVFLFSFLYCLIFITI